MGLRRVYTTTTKPIRFMGTGDIAPSNGFRADSSSASGTKCRLLYRHKIDDF